MPQVIIQANIAGGDPAEITLKERVVAANFESRHYTEQLIQRLGWATADLTIKSPARDLSLLPGGR